MLFDWTEIDIQDIPNPFCLRHGIQWGIARLDQIHPIISGNKIFKLSEFLDLALNRSVSRISTFGGPFSNHLVATAYACRMAGIPSRGWVRGGMADQMTHTLIQSREYGMELMMLDRQAYREQTVIQSGIDNLIIDGELIIPEGGYHPLGAAGASRIVPLIHSYNPTHIVVAVGTATTLAGILLSAKAQTEVIAVPVLKNMRDIPDRLLELGVSFNQKPWIADGFHFGGYARYDKTLLSFMNHLYESNRVPTDFVYTGKMMFATWELMQQGHFPAGSRVLCLHTGGLQGNLSLPAGSLIF